MLNFRTLSYQAVLPEHHWFSRIFFSAILLWFFLSCSSVTFAQEADESDTTGEAIALFNEGQDLHEKGDLAAAVANYEKALKIIPDFPEAEYQRGNALVQLGKAEEAESAFRNAVRLREDWTLALAAYGSVLVNNKKYDEADKILAKAIELDELNFPAYAAMADLLINTNASNDRLKALLHKLTELSAKANPPISLWQSKALIENKLGERQSAVRSIQRALEMAPLNTRSLYIAARVALDSGDTEKATGFIESFEKIEPASSDLLMLKIDMLVATEEYKEAIRLIDAQSNLDENLLTLRDRILTATTTDITELEKQIASDPENLQARERLCRALRTASPDKAPEQCLTLLKMQPENQQYRLGYAISLVMAKRYAESLPVLNALTAVDPENLTIRTNLASALFQLKRYEEAKASFIWITERQPKLAVSYYFLGIIHDQLKEYADAMANYQQFLRIADKEINGLEIDRVNLRLPTLEKQINANQGKKKE